MSRFEWDEEKNLVNQRKHGISFEEAATTLTVLCSHLKTKDTRAKSENEATVSLVVLW